MEPSLVLLFPDGVRRTVPLSDGPARGQVVLGRAADSTVEIDHPAVSRSHLRLVPVNGAHGDAGSGWRAEDTGSANGTLRNGDPLGPGAVDLRDGDCLAFGPDPAAVRAVYVHPAAGESGSDEAGEIDYPGVGTMLAGRYLLEESLGQTVDFQNYRALDAGADQTPVSLKVYSHGALPADAFPALVARVDRLRAIPPHPGVVRCLDARREEGQVFSVARWVHGGFPTLDLLRTRGALAPAEALHLLAAAASASDHAAEHGSVPLDFSLRPTLLAFHPPLDPDVWDSLRSEPLERWPTFQPRFAVALLAPLTGTSERLAALARFACELLGRPLPERNRAKIPRIIHPALGEAGNELLRGVLAGAGEPVIYASGEEFVAALVQAAGLSPALAPLMTH